jgi:hypothetical protein
VLLVSPIRSSTSHSVGTSRLLYIKLPKNLQYILTLKIVRDTTFNGGGGGGVIFFGYEGSQAVRTCPTGKGRLKRTESILSYNRYSYRTANC